ncbi:MAG: phosphate ABC transporter permease subunit PstC [Chloroflexi bacterium SZAS-1]|jgi:phosphate transport system permease protein|nr:phosphate ABC transporter permease subunit PstC [Chloroflexi bacterium SZAS-1]HNP87110.1 phosphate ABC transporter permease subunit PstC [Kouleothrix sp.]
MAQAERLSTWQTFQQRTKHGDVIFWLLTLFFALMVVALVAAVGYVAWVGSSEARGRFGLSFLFKTGWDPNAQNFGALPAIYGTLVSSGIALLIAGPLGILIGVFLSELCPQRFKSPLSFMVELLAAIPSVIYGMWGVFVFVPFFRSWVAAPIAKSVGKSFPLLAGPVAAGRGLMVAGIILAIMILPTIAAITRDVLAVVPNHQREAMLAVGATRWEMIRKAVLPYARAGIIGGLMLGLGRALGETMAALMVIGSVKDKISTSLFGGGITAASLVASELPNANDSMHESTLILIALVLFGITLCVNAFARLLVWQAARGPVGSARS